MMQNYPNPFREFTSFQFRIPVAQPVTLGIFNELGQKVTTVTDMPFEAGIHSVFWRGTDDSGFRVKPGLYFCEMKSGNFVSRKKIICL
jgi:flagellar hook assembly protein FlgD